MKTFTIITWKAGLANLWFGCTIIALTDKASTLSDAGTIIGAAGIAILGLAVGATFGLGVRALLSE